MSFELSWRTESRGNACVDEAALREAVEQRLGRKPFADRGHAEILIEAEESAVANDRFRARVTERDRHGVVRGVRVLEAQSCPSLRRAATLIVTLIIDPHLTGKRAEEGSAEPPAAPPVAGIVPSEPTPPPSLPLPALRPLQPPRPPQPRRPPLDFSLGLGAGTSVGVLPSASATVFAVARLEPAGSRWSFDWWGGYSFPQRLRDGPVRGDFAAVEQRVRSCFGFALWTSRKLDTCGGIVWGAILPETVGVRHGSDHWRILVGPTAAVAFEQRAGPIGTRVELGLTLGVRQYDFSYFNLANERKGFYSTDTVIFFVTGPCRLQLRLWRAARSLL
ncbi:MAG: hypothetical protein K0S65_6545 [Labilithrix sp.]|nr:hypothetical protein [Labilithrix sp.]